VGFAGSVGSGITLRINEVMSNPVEEPDNRHEWVELFNFGTEAVELAGWWIEDAQNGDSLPALLIPAGGYVVVAGGDYVVPDGVSAVRAGDGRIGLGLNNSGDLIRLRNPAGTVVDAMSYGDNTAILSPPPPAPEPGETIGWKDDRATWAETDRPTPGRPNEFPPEATATAGPESSPTRVAVLGETSGGADERDDDGESLVEPAARGGASPLLWLILGGAAGAGLLATSSTLWRLVSRLRGRRGD
jgi:hypothetical protein